MIPETTSREPVLSWLERNALDPNKVAEASKSYDDPRTQIKLNIHPDAFLEEWIESLGFDLGNVIRVDVDSECVSVRHYPETPDGVIGIAITTKVRFA